MSIKYRLALDSPSDARAFCTLYNSIYSKGITSKYYKWQFFYTPFPSYLIFAVEDGQVIGSLGVHVKTIMPNFKRTLSVLDMMVDLRHRGKGVFTGLMKKAMLVGQKYNPMCAIVMANKNGMNAICSTLGWNCVTRLETKQKTLETYKSQELLRNIPNQIPLFKGFHNLFPKNLFHIQHTVEYYKWRFQNHPTNEYLYTFSKTGYSITKIFENPVTFERYGDIIEIVGGDSKSLKELVFLSLKKLNLLGACKITTWLQTNTLWDTIGYELGFSRESEQLRYFCIKTFDTVIDSKLLEAKSWFVQPSDTEMF